MEKGITVIVCTYNGAERLPETIKHLAQQSVIDKINFEIIIVDNASTDQSVAIALDEWNKYNLKSVALRVLQQPKQGKVYALNMGMSMARFEYCVICDDDNWLRKDYLENTYKILENDPNIGAVGGRGIAVAESGQLPEWFADVEEGYACGKQAPCSSDITTRGHLWGAGLGTRTDLYRKVYDDFPSILTGRSENTLLAGEDAEFCQRIVLKGYRLFYSSDLVFQHFIPTKRLTIPYRKSLFKGFEESNKVLNKYYLANRIVEKCKRNPGTRVKLLLISYLKMVFSNSKQQQEQQRDIFILANPFASNNNSLISKIKRFSAADSGI